MKKALLINGYETFQGIGENTLNRSLIETTKEILESKGYDVKVTEVEQGYDIQEEHDKTLWADTLFIQAPIYWFNIPGVLKTYMDQIYTYGYAQGTMCTGDGRTQEDPSKTYGSGGMLTDKSYMISTTWNAPQDAFENDTQFMDGMTLDQSTFFLHKAYQFLGMRPLPSIAIFDVFKGADAIRHDVDNFKEHIHINF